MKFKIKKSLATLYFKKSIAQGCTLVILFLFFLCPFKSDCQGAVATNKPPTKGVVSNIILLNQDWLFGGKYNSKSIDPDFNDSNFTKITIPHCVKPLSWQNWKVEDWQDVWGYRRHFSIAKEFINKRVFLHFDGVMVGTTPTINGHTLETHFGGYLPFQYEITEWIKDKNILNVAVDSRWSNVPPQGAAVGAKRIDYLEPGGIHRSVYLEIVPKIYIKDVFAKPIDVLQLTRKVEVSCYLDAAVSVKSPVSILVQMKKGNKIISRAYKTIKIAKQGQSNITLTLSNLGKVTLWDIDNPQLYTVETTLFVNNKPIHNNITRIGLREIKFGLDGFYLNGKRLQLFGLNRHEIYPYVGFAMPDRVMRKDAEIIKKDLNCNIVRCSHYPQTKAFLDACDELGLLVWEEAPGWGYIGDDPWKKLFVRDVKDMIIRDRNHPSIIIWGTRVNESKSDIELYKNTRALAKSLDDSRPSSGSMTSGTRKTWKQDWSEDVFAYDDYHADPDGSVGIEEPTDGVPYMLAEAVGQFNYPAKKDFNCMYRRSTGVEIQQLQALMHAQAHNKAASNPHNCGVIAWCAFEYSSLVNPYKGIKYPGVYDVFRIPKLGASFYQSQGDPQLNPSIHPNFYWDFGVKCPKGPGKNVAIFSNCDSLKLFIDNKSYATLYPDSKGFQNLKHPPFFTDLDFNNGQNNPELRIDGYLNGKLVTTRSFSSDHRQDMFTFESDDSELIGNGSDATRVVFRVTDKFGAPRPFAESEIKFNIKGPGTIVGDNPFNLTESGGAGAIWIKTKSNSTGQILLQVNHPILGTKLIKILVRNKVVE